MEQERKAKRLRTLLPIGAVVIGLLVAIGFFLADQFAPDVEGVELTANILGGQHDSNLRYEFGGLPPIGGAHNPSWQNCGIYNTPVAPEYAIHSMEHGAVWITYHPDLPAEQVALLEDAARGQSYMLVSPYPDQENDIVMTAWGAQLLLDDATDPRVEEFIDRYKGRLGPEQGASCSNGIGTTTG